MRSIFASYFSWCGHIARIATRDPKRETNDTSAAQKHCLVAELKQDMGTQCHGRRFRVWRWEQAADQRLGVEWVKNGAKQ